MKKILFAAAAAAAVLSCLLFAGCDKSALRDSAANRGTEPTTTLGERMESGLTEAGERLREGLTDASEKVSEKMSDANETLSRAAEKMNP